MATLSDEDVGFGAPVVRSGNTPVIRSNFDADPKVQAFQASQPQRYAEGRRLDEAERGGGFEGFISTSSVVAGSTVAAPKTVLSDADVGFAPAAAKTPAPAGEGFLANLKNPLTLWTEESLPAHLYQAYQRGALGEIAERMRAAEPGGPRKGVMSETEGGAVTGRTMPRRRAVGTSNKPGLKEIYEQAKADPGKFAAELLNAVVADPELLLVPAGFGGRLAVGAGRAGRVAEAGLAGGGLNATLEGVKQAASGQYSREDMEMATALGGVLSAPFGALMRGRAGPAAPPRPGPAPRLTDQSATRRAGEYIPAGEGLPDVFRGARARTETPQPRDITPEPEAPLRLTDESFVRAPRPLEPDDYARFSEDSDRTIIRTQQELRDLSRNAEDVAFKERLGQDVGAEKQDLLGRQQLAQDALQAARSAKETLARMPVWAKQLGVGVAAYAGVEALGVDAQDALLFGAAALAVKQTRGGNWHPKAVETLSKPLSDKLTGFDYHGIQDNIQRGEGLRPNVEAQYTWSQKASQSYLNKHMGTATDPLSGYIEVPKLLAEKKNLQAYIAQHLQRKPPVLERKPLAETGEMEPMEKSQARLAAKERDYAEAKERAEEARSRIGEIDEAVKTEKGGIAYDAGSAIEIPFGEGTKKWGEVTDALVTSKTAQQLAGDEWTRADQFDARTNEPLRPILEGVASGKIPLDAPVWDVGSVNHGGGESARASRALKDYLSHVGDFLRENVLRKDDIYTWYAKQPAKYQRAHPMPEGVTPEVNVADLWPKDAEAVGSWLRSLQDDYAGYKASDPLQQYDLVRAVKETAAWDKELARKMNDARKAEKTVSPIYKEYPDGMYWQQLDKPGQFARESDAMGHSVRGYEPPKDMRGPAVARQHEDWVPESGDSGHPDYGVGGWDAVKDGRAKIYSLRDKNGRSHATIEVGPGLSNIRDMQDFVNYVNRDGGDFAEQFQGLRLSEREAAMRNTPEYAEFLRERSAPTTPSAILQIKGKQNRAPVAEYQKYVQDFVKEGKWGEVGDIENTGLVPAHQVLIELDRQMAQTERSRSREPGSAREQMIADFNQKFRGQKYLSPEEISNFEKSIRGFGGRESGKIDPKLLIGGGAALGAGLLAANLSEDKEDGGSPVRNAILSAIGVAAIGTAKGRAALKATSKTLDQGLGLASTRIRNVSPEIHHKLVDFERRVLTRTYNELEKIHPQLKKLSRQAAAKKVQEVQDGVEHLERSRMFGKNAVLQAGPKLSLNMEASIGNMIGEQQKLGRMTKEGAEELKTLLRSRFRGAEKLMPDWQQDFRNLTNAALLGNPGAAMIQFGDTLVAAYHHGLTAAVVGTVRSLGPNRPITARELGLANHIAQEFNSSPRATAKLLTWSFKWSGFSSMDQFGKNVNLNAALYRARKLADTEAKLMQQGATGKLGEKYAAAYGAEFPQLISELRSGKRGALTDTYLFHELSDIQPISKLETSQVHMDNPNVRLLYQLKSFALKQIDTARRDVWNEAKKGNRVKALGNAFKLGTAMGLAGMTAKAASDFLMGNEVEMDTDAFSENVLKVYMLSEWTRERLAQGKPGEALRDMVVPPYRVMDTIISGDPKAVSYLGPLGKLYYQHFMGGKEKEEERREKRERRKEREDD